MMGNYHVRFLGDKGGVIRLRYPIKQMEHTSTISNHDLIQDVIAKSEDQFEQKITYISALFGLGVNADSLKFIHIRKYGNITSGLNMRMTRKEYANMGMTNMRIREMNMRI
ncbi:MAG: hypothetical protein NTX61_04415 [Bacteroidetes bacterium]|nr:hypothetical protein [Bacteroidota bacterium]